MADSVFPPDRDAWRDDPRADFLGYQLLRLARAALSRQFGDDSMEAEYNTSLRRELRRKRGGKAWLLRQWDDHPEHGTLRLSAQPVANTFSLAVAHADFTADLTVIYDIDLAELDSAGITHFQGSAAAAIDGARFWVDELTDYGLDGLDLDEADLEEMLADAGLADAEDADDAPGAPPEDTIEDRRQVERMARALSRQVQDDEPPELAEPDHQWLEAVPQSLWPILDGAVSAAIAKPRDAKLFAAWLAMLNHQLELIRYRSDRGHKWAIGMLDQYQEQVKDLAAAKALDNHEDLFSLVAALGHAKVPVKPELSEALMSSGPSLPDSMAPAEVLDRAVRPMIDELARHVTSPFEVMEAMGEAAAVTPPALRCFMAHELALSPHAVMRDAVPLMLLDADAEVRHAAALALEQSAAPDRLSGASLRRAIALRNWIPEADRAALDQAIRKARMKGVQPAQWAPAPDLAWRASAIDGSGAQSMLFASRSGRSGLFAGLLLKQDFGIRDAWCNRATPRREIASAVAEMRTKLVVPDVERSYIDLAVQHGIALGVAASHLPDAALLEIAEAVSGADWKDRRIDAAAEIGHLFGELPAEQRSAGAIAGSLLRSVGWMREDGLWDSWFEDDAEVRESLAAARQQDVGAAARRLLEGVMAQRRDVWAERFLLTALWARAVKAGQPAPLGAPARAVTWRDLVVLAHEVLSERKLGDIPVMAEIAERTVIAARSGAW
ncbi:MAG TPA: hypothetical protein VND19_03855 [Acetobacteraceae bacterium]|nr:hypothetical protein [Acetobacteraceae bacterium]